MEIVTIPFTGALKHKDSTGGQGVIKAGDVQIMSAGTGVQHSEANESATEPVTLFQVWIFPKERNIPPRYDQRSFDVSERLNSWQFIVSPRENDGGLWINQDARFALSKLEKGKTLHYENGFKGNGVFLVVINGGITLEDTRLEKRDAIGIEDTEGFTITADEESEVLAIEVPMH
jgi:redox-sensitive bicupin YhaK (pirin superfamily)